MPRDLFEAVEGSSRMRPGRWYTVPLSLLVHAGLLVALIVVPLFAVDFAPTQRLLRYVTAPTARVASPRIHVRQPRVPALATPSAMRLDASVVPLEAPSQMLPAAPIVVSLGATNPGFPGQPVSLAAPGPVALARPPVVVPDRPIRIGGLVKAPRKLHDVIPVYPPVAVAARIEGTVSIEAVIARDGTVRDARVIGSVPALDGAALDAVRRWRYSPPTLNGSPVEVLMTVSVQFKLQH